MVGRSSFCPFPTRASPEGRLPARTHCPRPCSPLTPAPAAWCMVTDQGAPLHSPAPSHPWGNPGKPRAGARVQPTSSLCLCHVLALDRQQDTVCSLPAPQIQGVPHPQGHLSVGAAQGFSWQHPPTPGCPGALSPPALSWVPADSAAATLRPATCHPHITALSPAPTTAGAAAPGPWAGESLIDTGAHGSWCFSDVRTWGHVSKAATAEAGDGQ